MCRKATRWLYRWARTATCLSHSAATVADLKAEGYRACVKDGQVISQCGSVLMKRRICATEYAAMGWERVQAPLVAVPVAERRAGQLPLFE